MTTVRGRRTRRSSGTTRRRRTSPRTSWSLTMALHWTTTIPSPMASSTMARCSTMTSGRTTMIPSRTTMNHCSTRGQSQRTLPWRKTRPSRKPGCRTTASRRSVKRPQTKPRVQTTRRRRGRTRRSLSWRKPAALSHWRWGRRGCPRPARSPRAPRRVSLRPAEVAPTFAAPTRRSRPAPDGTTGRRHTPAGAARRQRSVQTARLGSFPPHPSRTIPQQTVPMSHL